MSSSSKPQLVYWDIRALGEPIRLLLHYLEIDFEDTRIALGETGCSADGWLNQKDSLGLDFPNLPFYIDEDVKISQSLAIMQHIGRKCNLGGDSLKEQAVIDMVSEALQDIRYHGCLTTFCAPEFPAIREDWKTTIPSRLAEFSKFLEGKDFVLGKKISYVDFILYETAEWFHLAAPEIFEQAPELADLNKFLKRIEALPQIKAYMESDKFKRWPVFSAIHHFGYRKDPNYKVTPYNIRNFWAKYPLDK